MNSMDLDFSKRENKTARRGIMKKKVLRVQRRKDITTCQEHYPYSAKNAPCVAILRCKHSLLR